MGETGCSRRRKDSRNYIRNNIDIYVCEVHRLTEFTAQRSLTPNGVTVTSRCTVSNRTFTDNFYITQYRALFTIQRQRNNPWS